MQPPTQRNCRESTNSPNHAREAARPLHARISPRPTSDSAMPTPHIGAQPGDFAETVLMPGDPLRAQFIAENWLTEAKLVTTVRNELKVPRIKGSGLALIHGPLFSVPITRLLASDAAIAGDLTVEIQGYSYFPDTASSRRAVRQSILRKATVPRLARSRIQRPNPCTARARTLSSAL